MGGELMANEINAHTAVRLQWVTELSVPPGGYFNVYCDAGDGTVDYAAEINSSPIEAWPEGGAFGFGRGRFGRGPFGRGDGGFGFGRGLFGRGPFGHGAGILEHTTSKLIDGDYKFAVCGVDAAGNVETPATIEKDITLAGTPEPPTGLEVTAYDSAADRFRLEWVLSSNDVTA